MLRAVGTCTLNKSMRPRKWPVRFFWLLFGSGLLVHLLAPNLERKEDAFVIPLAMAAGESTLQPERIVAKERRMQLTAAVLTAGGAPGLGFLYRGVLFRRAVTMGRNLSPAGEGGSAGGGGVPQP